MVWGVHPMGRMEAKGIMWQILTEHLIYLVMNKADEVLPSWSVWCGGRRGTRTTIMQTNIK